MKAENYTEVLFKYHSKILDLSVEELLWSERLNDNLYKLVSIPFYGPEIATGDVFCATRAADSSQPVFQKVVERSENSILQIMPDDTQIYHQVTEYLHSMECQSEKVDGSLFCLMVPSFCSIYEVISYLETEYKLEYAEAWLSKKHLKELRKKGYS